jgi:phospholipid/cholesterol/gamma-HCH transport system substrate-binding protein
MSADVHLKARLVFAAVFCASGLAAGAWYLWSSGQYTIYRIETHDPVSGLIADSPVELHGVEVGKVTKIELADPRTVAILLSVAKDAPVTRATVATITARGLAARGFTGYVYVALENTGEESGPLIVEPGRRYPVIPAAPSRIDTMDTTVAAATQKVRVLTRLLQSVLNEKTITSLKQSVGELQEMMAPLAANNDRLRSLIVNAENGSRDIRPLLNTSGATLRELRQVLPRFYQAIGDLDGLARSLNGVANRVARNPSTVIRGTVIPPGPGER